MRIILSLAILIFCLLNPAPVLAFWDDDAYVEHERQELTDWNSKTELEIFLGIYNHFTLHLKCGAAGKAYFTGACEDYAFQLRDLAETFGRRLEVEFITREEYHQYYGVWIPSDQCHAVNKAIIGNNVYYVEHNGGKIWLAHYLD